MEYIQRSEHSKDCFLCSAIAQDNDAENLVVFRGQNAFVILNRYPYTSGHVMVVPMQHTSTLEELDEDTQKELMILTTRSLRTLRLVYQPEAFNVGANIGEAAGAGIAEHLHFHVVPRWGGDTNFMSSLAATRVLPESLADTYQRMVQAWEEIK
jgi:ATP adenylyltransferase